MKIFLAGADQGVYSHMLNRLGYPYRLCSYHYLSGQRAQARETVVEHSGDGSEWIMDSGLFTLMFGAEKGKITTFAEYREYALKYVQAMHDWKWRHAIVECDVQKVLGVEECFRLREEILDQSGFEVIYVWHIPEGLDGLRKLAATKGRIALSVPELRAVVSNGSYSGGLAVKKALIKLIGVAREAGPAKIHLLGCTESSLLALPADSADSTSWEAISRWGNGYVLRNQRLEGVSRYSPRYMQWSSWVRAQPRWSPGFEQITEWIANERIAAGKSEADIAARTSNVTEAGVGASTMWLLMEMINGEST